MAKRLFTRMKELAKEARTIEDACEGAKKMLWDAQAEVQYQGKVIRNLNSMKDGLKGHNEMLERRIARLEVELESAKRIYKDSQDVLNENQQAEMEESK